MKAFSEAEMDLMKFMSDDLRSEPGKNVVRLDGYKSSAPILAIPSEGFDEAWRSLIERGFINPLTDGVATVTPAGLQFFRAAWR